MRRLLPLLLPAVPCALALRTSPQASRGAARCMTAKQLKKYTFRDFTLEFGRTYREGTSEYDVREEIFKRRLAEIAGFTSGPEHSWSMGINKFVDYTDAERKRMLGYTGGGSIKTMSRASISFSRQASEVVPPKQFRVKQPSLVSIPGVVRDQGNCGSCWAAAAVAVLEGQMAANSTLLQVLQGLHSTSWRTVPADPSLSLQAVVSCTPNPRHCGGSGGCDGATVELAYDMVQEHGGLPFAMDWVYQSGYGARPRCKDNVFSHAKIGMAGYTVLPTNKVAPLKHALVMTGGPVAVTLDATDFFLYAKGIYSDVAGGRQGRFNVNHAVTLMGYREPQDGLPGWWNIKNSWSEDWGENGYIRVEMKINEEDHCGWDCETHQGSACDGDPDSQWVCGTCGILYDMVYPVGVRLEGV